MWDQNQARTDDPSSPHYGCSDIWARYAPPGADGSKPHPSVWYPCAEQLPVRELVDQVLEQVQGRELGGVLLTRIPPFGQVRPHHDPGWHARYYEKFAVSIAAAPGQRFCFEDTQLETSPGDLFWFDNAYLHWVENSTPHERITLIACIRR